MHFLAALEVLRLYGLDNFYYRRCISWQPWKCCVYTDLIISTIVDKIMAKVKGLFVYTDLIISTIVDYSYLPKRYTGLYGLDNFYYRR